MVFIETTKHQEFLGTSQLTFHVAVFGTAVCLDRQTAVGPQLPLGAKTPGRLDQRYQESGTDRTDTRNLTQQFRRAMFPALGEEIPSHFSAQSL